MSFQFRRRGDVREQSPQQEPFFQSTAGQQPFVDTTVYPQMSQHQGYEPRMNNGFPQNQPHPQQMQNMQQLGAFTQQPAQPYFQANNGTPYSHHQAQGNVQQPQPMVNSAMGQAYGMAQPQMGPQQQYPNVMNIQDAYMHPIQASQLTGQKNNFQGYSQTAQMQAPQRQQNSSPNFAPEDVRSLSFWQESNANSGFEDYDELESNSPVRLLVAVAGVALIAGLSWFAYKWAKSPTSDTPPLIHAEPGPHKVSPEHRGGINIPYQDKFIYDRIGDGGTEEPAERLLPPPEKPSMLNSPNQQPIEQNQQNAPQQPMYSEAPMQNTMPGLPVPQAMPQQSVNTQLQPSNVQPQQQNQIQQPTPTVAAPIPSEQQPRVQDTEKEPEIVTKTTTAPTLKGSYFVQIATVKSEAAAIREWKRVQAKYNLKGMKSQIKESETTDGEIVYRLLMGPFEEKVKALKHAVKIDGTKVVHITE
jgi:hypothetical protein